MDIREKIKEIEEEIKRTQKNKATEKHIGKLKAKLAKLREKLVSKTTSSSNYGVKKEGDATVSLVGFPSVGKSSLLTKLTNAESKIGYYAFTTTKPHVGMLNYKGAYIQLIDLPGIIEGASQGLGRGKEVMSVARNSDLILIVLDPFNSLQTYRKIKKELYNLGFRLNTSPPNVEIRKLPKGGISTIFMEKANITEDEIKEILNEFGIHNAEVVVWENISPEDFIDAIQKNKIYVKSLTVINKADLIDDKERRHIEKIFKEEGEKPLFVSTITGEGLEELKKAIFSKLSFIRIYTKPLKGEKSEKPLLLRKGATVKDVCEKIHKDMVKNFKYALVWGKSVKFPGQRVGLNHKLMDEDIITIITKK